MLPSELPCKGLRHLSGLYLVRSQAAYDRNEGTAALSAFQIGMRNIAQGASHRHAYIISILQKPVKIIRRPLVELSNPVFLGIQRTALRNDHVSQMKFLHQLPLQIIIHVLIYMVDLDLNDSKLPSHLQHSRYRRLGNPQIICNLILPHIVLII